MKKIFIGKPNTIVLDQTIATGKNITLSIIGEDGSYIKDDNSQEIKDVLLTYDSTSKKYQKVITPNSTTIPQFIRLFFGSTTETILDNYHPEDAQLVNKVNLIQQIVPTAYFLDWVLAYSYKGDRLLKESITSFVTDNRDAIQRYLISAVDYLEKKTELYFIERTESAEKRDYYFDRFNLQLWQFTVNHPPINELLKFEIQYANTPIAEIATKLFVWDRETGIIEFLPAPGGDSAGLYTLLLDNLSGLTLTIFTHSNLERIPSMFRVSYKSGIYYPGADESEKEGIRQLVCVNALRKILVTLDPTSKTPTRTEGLDGVSATFTYNNERLGVQLKEQEDEYCYNLRRRYGKDVDMVIV